MIDNETKERIIAAAKIEEVVGDFVKLHRSGSNLKGLCPFHEEKTPSFMVSPSKNICKCFGCGKGGTPVNFIMEKEHLTFPEALRYLADKYHIEIKEKELTSEEMKAQSMRESMMQVNKFAAEYFVKTLWNTDEGKSVGLSYLRSRGITDEMIKKFKIGYCPDRYSAFYEEAVKSGFDPKVLTEVGLCTKGEKHTTDRFRGRVIFPVHSISGREVAFGGRALKMDEKTAKYVNSPESLIYHKSNELYGIYFAKNEIVKKDNVYLVEGYTDVTSMHQSGIENVVASSGTSLTYGQINMIHRFTSNITVLYDGDSAGIKASLRGIDMLLEQNMNVKVLLLPDGEDPDSFARSRNASDLLEYMEKNQKDFIAFKCDLALAEAGNDPIKRSNLINDILRSISVIPDEIKRSVYIQDCQTRFGIKLETLTQSVKKIITEKNQNAKPQASIEEIAPKKEVPYTYLQERELLKHLIKFSLVPIELITEDEIIKVPVVEYVAFMKENGIISFSYDLHKKIWDYIVENSTSDLRNEFLNHSDKEMQDYTFSLVEDRYEIHKESTDYTPEQLSLRLSSIIPQLVHGLELRMIEERLKEIKNSISIASRVPGADDQILALMKEQSELNLKKRQVSAELTKSKQKRLEV
ncbi:MAG: DNA primase [Paludibacteraceae bacterium]|nr:DNA primase [Paludibacteraceae bacterium]